MDYFIYWYHHHQHTLGNGFWVQNYLEVSYPLCN